MKKNILKKAAACLGISALMISSTFSTSAKAATANWNTFYASSYNKQMNCICKFQYHVGTYNVRMDSSAGSGVGISNMIQGAGGTVLSKASTVVTPSRPNNTVNVVSSGSNTTYINSILSFNINNTTAYTTGTIWY